MKSNTAAQIVRLKFIDATAIVVGAINRADIMASLSIDQPTASRDFRRYLEAGGAISFSHQRRQYERNYHFKSLYFESETKAEEWLKALDIVYGNFKL